MKRFIPLFIPTLFLAAAIGAYVFLSFRINEAAAHWAAARASAQALGQEGQFQKSVGALLKDTQFQRSELASFVATDSTLASLTQMIKEAAKREKISVAIGAISPAPSDWKYHEPLTVSLSARGSLAAIAAFATDLESLPVASHLSVMSLEVSDNRTWLASFTVDFVKEKPPTSLP
ncbi:hypothetical protein HY090_00760 [Candidatus Kaiserbacteria bacterium]|nr:hypothetical protein [Candidatus Kaiserbacteria bacterium]